MEATYCEPIVQCLQILARRGRAVREAQARQKWNEFVAWMNSFLGGPDGIEIPEDED